jgi:hypothetical protein
VAYPCNTSTWEAPARGFQVSDQAGLYSEIPSQKKKKKPNKPQKQTNKKPSLLSGEVLFVIVNSCSFLSRTTIKLKKKTMSLIN